MFDMKWIIFFRLYIYVFASILKALFVFNCSSAYSDKCKLNIYLFPNIPNFRHYSTPLSESVSRIVVSDSLQPHGL